LQVAKKETAATKSLVKTLKLSSRLQDITEGGVVACEKQGEEVRMKESQIQKARVVAQMMPAQVPL
jgi:hypothetical protein